ncbi:MAG: hypothetical protein CME64_06775 [Halobacteriovoraceae bacterium]|nr:hypothetical protein [Halobacteriovoraceae bacterium]|tara:strand:- start:22892 stop:23410 length:519 start_codon:yes stop_codon:yes gene_type:complete
MKDKLENNIFSKLEKIEQRLDKMERRLERMDQQTKTAFQTIQAQMVRVKNGEKLPDDYLLNRRGYNDLSPEKAQRIFGEKNRDFILLDVSEKAFHRPQGFPEAIHLPLEELGIRHKELPNKTSSMMIISEDGTRSILACELLNKHGFYNLNNVSGGYKYWPQERKETKLRIA